MKEQCMLAKADARGTVCIPAAAVRTAGYKPGYGVVAVPNEVNRFVTVMAPELLECHDFVRSSYTVDRAGNIRITAALLQHAGIRLCKGDPLVVSFGDHKIVLTLPRHVSPAGPLCGKEDQRLTSSSCMRSKGDIDRALATLKELIWYDVVSAMCRDVNYGPEVTELRRLETQYRGLKLSPHTDFEWGEIRGKLSALDWVRGYAWDRPLHRYPLPCPT